MTIRTKLIITPLLLVFITASLPAPVSASGSPIALSGFPKLTAVIEPEKNEVGQPRVLQELNIDDSLTFPIVQQPPGNITFVSPLQNYVTQFQTASTSGTVGLLAHNYLAGRYFFQITSGQEITLVYGDAGTERFVVTEILEYQALTPESPSSDFIDLATGEHQSAFQVFKRTYGTQSGRLILQTCIAAEQNPSWGRLFIIAEPTVSLPTSREKRLNQHLNH